VKPLWRTMVGYTYRTLLGGHQVPNAVMCDQCAEATLTLTLPVTEAPPWALEGGGHRTPGEVGATPTPRLTATDKMP
jgi:hypothetical protein